MCQITVVRKLQKQKAALKQKNLTKDRWHVAQLDKTQLQDTVLSAKVTLSFLGELALLKVFSNRS